MSVDDDSLMAIFEVEEPCVVAVDKLEGDPVGVVDIALLKLVTASAEVGPMMILSEVEELSIVVADELEEKLVRVVEVILLVE